MLALAMAVRSCCRATCGTVGFLDVDIRDNSGGLKFEPLLNSFDKARIEVRRVQFLSCACFAGNNQIIGSFRGKTRKTRRLVEKSLKLQALSVLHQCM